MQTQLTPKPDGSHTAGLGLHERGPCQYDLYIHGGMPQCDLSDMQWLLGFIDSTHDDSTGMLTVHNASMVDLPPLVNLQ